MLKKLQGFNISNNFIEDFEPNELPENIQLINMRNNPVCLVPVALCRMLITSRSCLGGSKV
jgi:Leucine-rich repeat (LRR) protein